MTRKLILVIGLTVLISMPKLAFAQNEEEKKEEPKQELQYYKPLSAKGRNIFEPAKFELQPKFNGMFSKLGFSASTQIQNLSHKNTAVGAGKLYPIGLGANLPMANLYINAQLADGIRLMSTGYMASHHHNEFWMKDGYIQIDRIPLKGDFFQMMSMFTRMKVGHQEINYGDAHFRRSDGGNSNMNPFIGNYILDAFTTEIGAEGTFWVHPDVSFMFGITSAEIKGNVTNRELSKPAFMFKAVGDKRVSENFRTRVSYSRYEAKSSPALTLYSGDRSGGGVFVGVLEKEGIVLTSAVHSGDFNPGFSNALTANMINGFVEYKGLEFFGTYEFADGEAFAKDKGLRRDVSQYAGDIVYRFNAIGFDSYVGVRRNTVTGELLGIPNKLNINRWALVSGFNLTPNILMKLEYLNQEYKGYPANHMYRGGKFHGFVLESGVSF